MVILYLRSKLGYTFPSMGFQSIPQSAHHKFSHTSRYTHPVSLESWKNGIWEVKKKENPKKKRNPNEVKIPFM